MENFTNSISAVWRENGIRYFAYFIPANKCYVKKLVVTAMPDETDLCPKIAGHLVVSAEKPLMNDYVIDWVEVDKEYRRQNIAETLWNLAEMLLNAKFVHMPGTALGRKFAKGISKRANQFICKQ